MQCPDLHVELLWPPLIFLDHVNCCTHGRNPYVKVEKALPFPPPHVHLESKGFCLSKKIKKSCVASASSSLKFATLQSNFYYPMAVCPVLLLLENTALRAHAHIFPAIFVVHFLHVLQTHFLHKTVVLASKRVTAFMVTLHPQDNLDGLRRYIGTT